MRPPLLLVSALLLAAQQDPVFKSGVSLVRVDAQVTEGKRIIGGLTQADFEIRDNGLPVPIEYFGRESEPLHLLLLLDVSGSMRRLLDEMASASRQALAQLLPEDQVAVVAFSRRTVVKLDFSRDRGDAAAAIGAARFEKETGSGTLVNPSLLEAVKYLSERAANQPGRRAILVFTDNQSVNYQSPDQPVIEALLAADTVLNAIVTPDAKPPGPNKTWANPDYSDSDVFRLARETGGEVIKAGKGAALAEMVERIRTRYSLHFRAPEAPPGQFHRLEVSLSPGARARFKKAEIRARSGYVTR
jgi:VWFA-related protein